MNDFEKQFFNIENGKGIESDSLSVQEQEEEILLDSEDQEAFDELVSYAEAPSRSEILLDMEADFRQNASEILPEIFSQFNKFHLYPDDFEKAKTYNGIAARGVASLYRDYGFFGKYFENKEKQEAFFEIWRLNKDGKEEFFKGRNGTEDYEKEVNPAYSGVDMLNL
jgi:hypothetical protein